MSWPPKWMTEPTPWDSAEAIRMENAADGLVAQLGVPGRDRIIWVAAEQCVKAHTAQNLDGVRAACQRIVQRARELSKVRV